MCLSKTTALWCIFTAHVSICSLNFPAGFKSSMRFLKATLGTELHIFKLGAKKTADLTSGQNVVSFGKTFDYILEQIQ